MLRLHPTVIDLSPSDVLQASKRWKARREAQINPAREGPEGISNPVSLPSRSIDEIEELRRQLVLSNPVLPLSLTPANNTSINPRASSLLIDRPVGSNGLGFWEGLVAEVVAIPLSELEGSEIAMPFNPADHIESKQRIS
jgi:hypothetical protein